MTKKELQARYKELYGEQPEESVTVKELNALIKEKEDETPVSEDEDALSEEISSSDANDSEATPEGKDEEDAEDIEEPVNESESVPEAQEQGEVEEKSGEKVFVDNPRLLKKVEGKKETSKKTYYYGELR